MTILPDCLGVFSFGGTSCESSSSELINGGGPGVTGVANGAGVIGIGVGAGVGVGVGGAVTIVIADDDDDNDGAFRFLLNFFCSAAARTKINQIIIIICFNQFY